MICETPIQTTATDCNGVTTPLLIREPRVEFGQTDGPYQSISGGITVVNPPGGISKYRFINACGTRLCVIGCRTYRHECLAVLEIAGTRFFNCVDRFDWFRTLAQYACRKSTAGISEQAQNVPGILELVGVDQTVELGQEREERKYKLWLAAEIAGQVKTGWVASEHSCDETCDDQAYLVTKIVSAGHDCQKMAYAEATRHRCRDSKKSCDGK